MTFKSQLPVSRFAKRGNKPVALQPLFGNHSVRAVIQAHAVFAARHRFQQLRYPNRLTLEIRLAAKLEPVDSRSDVHLEFSSTAVQLAFCINMPSGGNQRPHRSRQAVRRELPPLVVAGIGSPESQFGQSIQSSGFSLDVSPEKPVTALILKNNREVRFRNFDAGVIECHAAVEFRLNHPGVLRRTKFEFGRTFKRNLFDLEFYRQFESGQNRKLRNLTEEIISLRRRHCQVSGLPQHPDPPESVAALEPRHVFREQHHAWQKKKRLGHGSLEAVADQKTFDHVCCARVVSLYFNFEGPWGA